MSEEVKRSISGFSSAFSKILLKCVRNTNHKHILKLYILFAFENVATNIDRQKIKDIGTELYFCQCLIRMWFSTPL